MAGALVITDGRGLADGTVLSAEVCVVGGGAAGIAIARSLAGAGRSVVVIESGGFEFDDAVNALNQGALVGEDMTAFDNHRPLDATRQRFLGGSTNCWFGWCRPMDPSDFEPRPWLGVTSWPFRRTEIEPHFDEVAALVEIGPPRFDTATWIAAGAGPAVLDTPTVATTVFQYSPPSRFGERFRDDLTESIDIQVITLANVVEIETPPAADHVSGVAVATLDGNRLRVEASTFVLATGGVEVPRLLLASNRHAPAGLGNTADLVGRYFMEHPFLPVGTIVLGVPRSELALYERQQYAVPRADGTGDGVDAMGVLTISGAAQAEHQCLSSWAMLTLHDPEFDSDPGSSHVTGSQIAELVRRGGADDVTVAALGISGEQLPTAGSRVVLGTEVDALGMPRVAVDWQHHPADRDSFVTALELIGREVGRLGLGRAAVVPGGVGPWDLPLWVQSHHMGTARMADTPADGVVDPDCRVHGIDNLYVAGSAVFPTAGSVNPTFTLLALALRLAHHVDAVLS